MRVWIGDAAQIRAEARVRKQKTDRRDAAHILDSTGEECFSADMDTVPAGTGSGWQLAGIHRHKLRDCCGRG